MYSQKAIPFSQILIYCTCYHFYRYMQKAKQTRELLPLCAFSIFIWCQTCQNFSKYHDYLVSTTHILFFKCNIVLCHCSELFPHLLLFYVNYSPQQTSAVKTLPLHTPISLVLSFLSFFSNEFPIQFLRTYQISFFQFQQYKLNLHAIFQFMFFCFNLYIFSKHHHHYEELVLTHHKHHRLFRSWHNATTKFNHYNIHNSFRNSVIQSAYQPPIYSRLN